MCEIWEEVLQEGLAEGERKTELSSIRNLMETMQLTAQQAMYALKIPEDKRKEYAEQL